MASITEILTRDGVTLTSISPDAEQLALIEKTALAFGGIVVRQETDAATETVLQIMEQSVVGTELTDQDGVIYELWPEGWYTSGVAVDLPPYETVIAATIPGGWSWSA